VGASVRGVTYSCLAGCRSSSSPTFRAPAMETAAPSSSMREPMLAVLQAPGHRRFQMLAPADAASCRRTRPCSCSEAGDSTPQTSRMAGGSDARGKKEPRSGEVDVQRGDELLVQEIPSMDSLEHDGASVKSLDERSAWQAYLSRILDGISALFSLACGSATLACMGVLEWSTLATLGVFVASLSTAIGSLMVVATAAVGVLALLDTLRTSANDEDADDDALQALAAPPRRLGSMGGKKLQ